MIQLACIMFLASWAFWTWASGGIHGLVENAIFAFPLAMLSTAFMWFIVVVVIGAAGGFAK